jgi:hypothetical protein
MTNNKQQTAVEILCGKLAMKLGMPQAITFYIDHQEEIKEAKEMEKEQKIMDYEMGYINGGNQKKITGEQYYEQTYGGDKQ